MSALRLSPAQRAAIELDGRDLLVTAGAGAGKTTVLVERVLYKLKRWQVGSLDDLLVVTFTDKAARELKNRIYMELSEDPGMRRHLVQLPRASISTIHSFCARLLREHFLEARIEPAFRVLDDYGRSDALNEAMRRVFHGWYLLGDTGLGRTFQSLLEVCGFDRQGEVLRSAVSRLNEYARATSDPDEYLDHLLLRPPAVRLADLPWYREMVAQLGGESGDWTRAVRLYRAALTIARQGGRKVARMEEFLECCVAVSSEALAEPEEQRRAINALKTGGFVKDEPSLHISPPDAPRGAGSLPGFKLLHDAAKQAFLRPSIRALPWILEELVQEETDGRRYLEVLVKLVREVDEEYRHYKARGGFLDFSDLEIGAARLLRESGRTLGLEDRFREVLIDEFQDVNALQDEILRRVSRENRRFRVGDVKQSIYQFRLADPTIFLELMKGRVEVKSPACVPPGDDPSLIYLSENHRSTRNILCFANRVFARLFDEKTIGSGYAEQRLIWPDDEPSGDPNALVELHLVISPARSKTPAVEDGNDDPGSERDRVDQPPPAAPDDLTPIERQARLTAHRVRRLLRDERPMIRTKDGPRLVRAGDVALLLRSAARAQKFLEALEGAGVPAFLAKGGSLLEEDAVRDFRSLLAIIDNPRDDVALAAVLRSPLHGVPDSDLLRIHLARPKARSFLDAVAGAAYAGETEAEGGCFWPPPAAGMGAIDTLAFWVGEEAVDAEKLTPPSLRRRLREFLGRLKSWREEQGRMELGRFLTLVLEDTRFFAMLRGQGILARQRTGLERFLSLAQSYEEERGPSLHGFLARIATAEAAGQVESVSAVGEDEDAVRILTIHGAKGLEFPVVVLPNLEWRFRPDPLGNRIRIGREWIGLRHFDYDRWGRTDTSARRALAEIQKREQVEEEARILYVALTRARDRLILVGGATKLPEIGTALPKEAVLERIREGKSALDWILASLPWEQAQEGRWEFQDPPLIYEAHAEVPGSSEAGTSTIPEGARNLGRALQEGRSLAASSAAEAKALSLLDRVGCVAPVPRLADLPGLKGKYWVTELKKAEDAERRRLLEEEGAVWAPGTRLDARGAGSVSRAPLDGSGAGSGSGRPLDARGAAELGILYHAALARLDLLATGPAELEAQFRRMAASPWWGGAPRDEQVEKGIFAILQGEWGRRLADAARAPSPGAQGSPDGIGARETSRSVAGRDAAVEPGRVAAGATAWIEREVPFSLKWSVERLASFLPDLRHACDEDPRWATPAGREVLARAWVLIQGQIDCIFRSGEEWFILDWKTDRVRPEGVSARAVDYAFQMRVYAEAAALKWGAPVRTILAFVSAGVTFEMPCPT